MAGIERRLSVLEAKVPPLNGHSHEQPSYVTLEDLYDWLRSGNLHFDAPGHVGVGVFIGKSTAAYQYLAEMAAKLNECIQMSPPGAVLAPLMPAQVKAAQEALDRGDFRIMKYSDYGTHRGSYMGIGAQYSAPLEIWDLANVVSGALKVLIDQLPPDYNKADYQSLEGLRTMLEWCKANVNDFED